MTLAPDPTDDATIRRYVLGDLDDDVASSIEDRYFADESFLARVEEVIDEICDDYARGELPARDRERVESLATAPDWQRRLRSAIALQSELAATSVSTPGSRPRADARVLPIRSWMRPDGGVRRVLLAAASVLLLLGWPGWIAQIRTERARLTAARSESTRELTTARSQLATERARRQDLVRQLERQSTLEFSLAPGALRGEGSALVVPVSATFVRLQLALDGDAGSRARAVLLAPDGSTIWSQHDVDLQPRDGRSPSVSIPALSLMTGDYQLVLQERSAAPGASEIARYAFRVVRR